MDSFEISQLGNLKWSWGLLCVVILMTHAAFWKTRARRLFASSEMMKRMWIDSSPLRSFSQKCCVLLTMVFLVLSLMDFRWGQVQRELPQRGIEVMFLLDVSKSMLAEDVKPNRLERAKQMIRDTVDEMSGDRIGLTVFAGEARQRIPMTNHYEEFKLTLAEVGPEDLTTGGSRLGDAIRVAADGFLAKRNDHQAIVIFTDGEDQESDPVGMAKEVFEDRGIQIFPIGLGDFRTGGRVPLVGSDGDRYLQFKGEQVWSKLDGQVLSAVAQASQGEYIPAGTKLVKMSDFYYGYLAAIEQLEFEKATFSRLEARYQWFLAPAILALLMEWLLSIRKPIQQDADFVNP